MGTRMICNICGLDMEQKTECAWTSCPKNFEWPSDESRIDVVGQNGNDGLHYNEQKDS